MSLITPREPFPSKMTYYKGYFFMNLLNNRLIKTLGARGCLHAPNVFINLLGQCRHVDMLTKKQANSEFSSINQRSKQVEHLACLGSIDFVNYVQESEEHFVCTCSTHTHIKEQYIVLYKRFITNQQRSEMANPRHFSHSLLELQKHRESTLIFSAFNATTNDMLPP